MSVTIHAGDNRVSLAALPENSIDAVVTDPPYSLTSITKRFGKEGSAPPRRDAGAGNDGSFGRVSGGFMGKAWDATGIERDPEFWALVYRVLKPGGFVFAFSGARTGHWQACAMEQAGFIMHPMHAWLYGSGFPKGHDASKAIDKHLGTEGLRETTNVRYEAKRFAPGATVVEEGGYRKRVAEDGNEQTFTATDSLGGSPEARAWDGWKYGTQTQKPAMEPIYLGQKPYEGKPVESILKWGVGAFNVDGCRVPFGEGEDSPSASRRQGAINHLSTRSAAEAYADGKIESRQSPEAYRAERAGEALGRYPANLLHDGSPEVVALFPDSKGQLAAASTSTKTRKTQNVYGDMARGSDAGEPRGDEGSAARFFNSFPWPLAFYHAKAGKADRAGSKHPTVKPIGLLRHLIRHICPPGGVVLDPFAGSGTTAAAALSEGMSCVLMEAEPEYLTFLRQRFSPPSDFFAATGTDFFS